MKVHIKRTKTGASIVFKAQSDRDAKNLKTAVLAAAQTGFTIPKVIDELEKLGYRDSRVSTDGGLNARP